MASQANPLTIGISAFFQYSFFSNGTATCMLSLADALRKLGHKVVIVNSNGTNEWYEDCTNLKHTFERRNLVSWNTPQLDIFIDIDGYIIPEVRRKIAKQVVVFIRNPVFLTEIEKTVYPIQGPVRELRNCDAVWTWEHFGTQDTHILELLSEKPVFRLPYTWSPLAVEDHGGALPSWMDVSKQSNTWTCHLMETNTTMASNSTLPLVILGYTKTHSSIPMDTYYIHNSQMIEKQDFFKDNVYNHCVRDGLKAEFAGRQRITDWRLQPKSFVLSHTRFVTIQGKHLDCVWNGIPLIHNSPWLKQFGHGFERYYYEDNSVKGAKAAIDQMVSDYTARSGIFADGALSVIRQDLVKALDVRSTGRIEQWTAALTMTPSSLVTSIVEPIVQKATSFEKSELVVGFSDLWADANHEYNFWTLLLQEACKKLTKPISVRSVKITAETVKEPIDLLIFAPFGDVWKSVPTTVPKVFITGENRPSRHGNGVVLNLGFEATNKEKGIYRFPLWCQYIDWFGADQERLINPRTLPIDYVTKVDTHMLEKKDKFCAFIVSNPTNEVRNTAFQWLNSYKKVDSAGRLFNNIGDTIFTQTAGGGGGELNKHEFLKDYKYCFAYENSRTDGYITEKFLAAKAAGCVPIYWGAQNPTEDFPEGSFINANEFQTADDLISAVKALEENPEAWKKMASIPAITVEKERRRLAEVACLLLEPVLGSSIVNQLPRALGASSTAEAHQLFQERESAAKLKGPLKGFKWNGKSLLVTFATEKYIQSLLQWLASANLYQKDNSTIMIRVYLGDDVGDHTLNVLRSQNPTVNFRRIPSKTLTVPGFSDLWEPQHFAWKLWIYQELVQEAALQNTLIWYMDAGSIIVRWPITWLEIATREGLCMLEDKEQKNDQWCHPEFCSRLRVTDSEMAAQQVVGGIMAFVGGARLPWKIFAEAWVYGQQRRILVGPKWAGVFPDGRPFGHRHDQSILSILRLRHKVPVHPLENVYNHESLRRTFKAGAALYVHRGDVKEHVNFAPRIGEVHLINLARRSDRIQTFKDNHEPWTKQICLRPAYDGRALKLTPALAKVFEPNDFLWKKAIMGCALSHMSLWVELAQETSSVENYLILEDDVKFQKGWLSVWEEAAKLIPDDYDVLYLGGVLPPNRAMFEQLIEPVNQFWGKVKPNNVFGQNPPTPYFHFCNYSYILKREGAQKVLQGMQPYGGYHTSADHMICNRVQDMKHYVLLPQVAGCYQDEDPKYQTSQFNNFNRVDGFDSDLWNNDERFSEQDINAALDAWTEKDKIPIGLALEDATRALRDQPPVAVQEKAPVSNSIPPKFYTVGGYNVVPHALYEYKWLRELFGSDFETIGHVDLDHEPMETTPIFICARPNMLEYTMAFNKYEAAGRPFKVIHLSDEFCNDPVEFYSLSMCTQVFRMYPRSDYKCPEKVTTLPLGSYRTPVVDTNQQRHLLWSFFGTGWKEREKELGNWKSLQPCQYKFFEDWGSAKLSEEEYSKLCAASVFMPCPRGQSVETFRFWEALEHGAIPIYVRNEHDMDYYKFISKKLPIISFQTWDQALGFVQSLLQNPPTLAHYRTTILEKWSSWKAELKERCNQGISC
jgi:GR25 family glycosyltransferase involved in LPS biosynthesis